MTRTALLACLATMSPELQVAWQRFLESEAEVRRSEARLRYVERWCHVLKVASWIILLVGLGFAVLPWLAGVV